MMEAFPTLLENLDLVYKICWVFSMKYLPAVGMVFRLLDSYIYNQSSGRLPASVAELAAILAANKTGLNIQLCQVWLEVDTLQDIPFFHVSVDTARRLILAVL
jgi:hypothetical protein